MARPEFAVIGPGTVGQAIAQLLTAKGYVLKAIAGRDRPWEAVASAELVIITTPDRVIGEVCSLLAGHNVFRSGMTVVHMSGALTSEVLTLAKEAGSMVLSLHPLQSFARVEEAVANLPGSVFTLEGDKEAFPLGKQIVRDLGGKAYELTREGKALYHAAAVVASNYLVSLAHLGTTLLAQTGIPPESGITALMPLMNGVLRNIQALGPAKALTGPIARGDLETIQKHLEALPNQQALVIYRTLGAYTVGVALKKGSIGQEAAADLLAVLKEEV